MKTNRVNGSSFIFVLRETWHYSMKIYLFFLLNIMLVLILSAVGIFTPRFIITELTGPARVHLVIMIALIYFMMKAFAELFLANVTAGYNLDLARLRYFFIGRMKEKIMKVKYENLENPNYLNEFWRVTQATSDPEYGLQGMMTQLFILSANAVSSLFYLSILGRVNLLIVLLLIINIYLVYKLQGGARAYEVKMSNKVSVYRRREGWLSNTMGNMAYGKDIRIYGLSNYLLEKLVGNQKSQRSIYADIQRHHFKADWLEFLLAFIRDAVIYGYLIFGVLRGTISIADFTMYFMTVAALTITLSSVFKDIAFVKNQMPRLDEMKKFLELPEEKSASWEDYVPIPSSNAYEITFWHVSFHYPGTDENVYTDFNFTIKAGKKLAIVGVNGAGKTTLIKLITRLYDPTEGQILLNGIDIKRFAMEDYRKLLTVVFQDVNLFAMSLKENITGTDGPYDEAKLLYAIEHAGIGAFFEQYGKNENLPMTRYLYDEGVEVSGGEKQKIGIARALYKSGEIIIFDEPTAALDAYAEYKLYCQLAEISKDKTLLFISHRLASTRFCDEIALIDHGRVAEFGTHEELLEKQGMYYQMFTVQKKYYSEGGAGNEVELAKRTL